MAIIQQIAEDMPEGK